MNRSGAWRRLRWISPVVIVMTVLALLAVAQRSGRSPGEAADGK
jgi:hypothetical protein